MEEELSLRELIEIILEKKKFIAIVTAACMAISAIVSIFILKPVYETKEVYSIDPVKYKSSIVITSPSIIADNLEIVEEARKLDNKMLAPLISQVQYPDFSINKIVNEMSSPQFINEVLKIQGLNNEDYDYQKNIKVSLDTKTNLISVSVKYENSKKALEIKDTIIKHLPVYLSNIAKEQLNRESNKLNDLANSEVKSLEGQTKNLNQFISEIGGSNKINELTGSQKTKYENLKYSILLSNQAIDSYKLINKELDIMKLQNVENLLNIRVISQDKLPLKPTSPKKVINITIAGILGFMISIFYVLFLKYWNESGTINSQELMKSGGTNQI